MNEQDSIFYINKDHLGSFDVITNPDGSVREMYNYDPWGRRRNPADWSYNNVPEEFFLDRGFTGHEHLDKLGLINMNGRVYDPVMALFLSPDNFVQSPDLTQNFNRYTYCLNNPLKYSDPSGYSYKAYMDDRYDEGNYWYRGQAPVTWTDWQSYHHMGGGGGGYFYNSYTGQYKNEAWETVDYSEVHNNYIVPNSDFSFSGEIARNFLRDYLSGGDATINRNHIEIKKTDFLGIKGLTLYSYYGFDIDKNRKDYNTSGGVYIRLGYESATGKWVQLVTSSDRPSPFIDTFSKNSYYYPNQWVEGGITIFEDWPLRPWDVSWRADLLFEEQGEVIIHLNYGFDIKGGKTNIIPFRSFKPVPFEYFMQGYPY